MSDRVDSPAEREHNHRRSVRAGDRKLRKPEPHGGRRAEENGIRNLTTGFKNVLTYRTLRYTYVDANTKTEHKGLCMVLLSRPQVKLQCHKRDVPRRPLCSTSVGAKRV